MAQTAAPTPEASAQAAPAVKRGIALGLIAVFTTYFLAYYIMQTQGIALPRMTADLDGMPFFSWGIAIPALASAIATLLMGKLSDMYGRRIILATCTILFFGGTLCAALAQSFVFLTAARFVQALGMGAIAPLCFSVLGDMFEPAERSKWSGLLNIPAGICALIGPTLAGIITDSLSWRYLFWIALPIAVISFVLIVIGLPAVTHKVKHKLDLVGALLMIVGSATMIVGFSWGGVNYPWLSVQVIGMLAVSVLSWAVFIWYEGRVEEPLLDPQVLTNRVFITAALAGFFSFFGLLGIMNYYPLFLQGVQGISATISGSMITPFAVLMAFMGVPAGILLGKTKKYKWMFVGGYGILCLAMFGMWTFNQSTPIWLGVLITALAGLGLGSIPTINTLVVQFALPKRLLGIAVGAIFFFVMMGMAIAPAILGSFMNSTYASALQASLPAALSQNLDPAALAAMTDSRVLLTPEAMAALESSIGDAALFEQAVVAIRGALEASLKSVFLIGAITMVVSFLMIITIPEVSMDAEVEDKRAPKAE